jgi:hypothetical protein
MTLAPAAVRRTGNENFLMAELFSVAGWISHSHDITVAAALDHEA